MEKIEKYQEELNNLIEEREKITQKITHINNKITKLKVSDEKLFVQNIPLDDIKSITKEQWEWLLYHYHDETHYGYKTRTDFFNKLALFTNMIAGGEHSDKIRQFSFTLHEHHNIDNFFNNFNYILPYLKEFPSKLDKKNIVNIKLYMNVYGWDYNYDGIYIEIDKKQNKARFVRYYTKYDNKKDWITIDDCKKELKKYKKY